MRYRPYRGRNGQQSPQVKELVSSNPFTRHSSRTPTLLDMQKNQKAEKNQQSRTIEMERQPVSIAIKLETPKYGGGGEKQ